MLDRDQTFCLNGEGARTRPDAPATSPYPAGCGNNPFTLGAVWGLQAGWSASTFDYNQDSVTDLAAGKYTAKVSINKSYRDFFKIPAYESSLTLNLTVKDATTCAVRGCMAAARKAAAGASVAPKPNAKRPTGKASVPAGPKPDLRPPPAWQITVGPGEVRHTDAAE